jgi:hypothetical protein
MGLRSDVIRRQKLNSDYKEAVRTVVGIAALPAYTTDGQVITADAAGPLPAQASVTLALNDSVLLDDAVPNVDAGIYKITQLDPFEFTRRSDFNTSVAITAGAVVKVEEGDFAGTAFELLTPNPIVLNTTPLDFDVETSGLGFEPGLQTGSFNADAGKIYVWDTSDPSVEATLPAAPADKAMVGFLGDPTAGTLGALEIEAGTNEILRPGFGDEFSIPGRTGYLLHTFQFRQTGGAGVGYWVLTTGDAGALLRTHDYKDAVRLATTAALPAYTRVGNTITENGNGALPDQDGVTPFVGESFLLLNGAAGADNGIWDVTDLGSGATPFILDRREDLSISDQVNSGLVVPTGPEGTENGSKIFILATPQPITLNTTALSFIAVGDANAIHNNVASEISALALVTAAAGDHILIEDADDSNAKKRVAASDFLGGGGNAYTAFELNTEANDGETVDVAKLYIIAESADMGLRLPATGGISIGDSVFFMMAGSGKRIVIETNDRFGVGDEAIIGEGTTGSQYFLIAGESGARFMFRYTGTGAGVPVWEVTSLDVPFTAPARVVEQATASALPAYTPSGTDEDAILTADANGALIIDGQPAQVSDALKGGVLVKNETGGDAGNNGVMQVLQVGDGSNPWILRKRIDWHFSDVIALGATISVSATNGFGGSNEGKTYVVRPGSSVSNQLPESFKERSRIEDLSGDGWGFTSGVATDVTTSIQTLANDTAVSVRVRTIAQDDTSNEMAVYVDEVAIKRNGAGVVTVEVVAPVVAPFEDFTPATDAVTYVVNGSAVDITVLGTVGHDVEWRSQFAATYLPLGGG